MKPKEIFDLLIENNINSFATSFSPPNVRNYTISAKVIATIGNINPSIWIASSSFRRSFNDRAFFFANGN